MREKPVTYFKKKPWRSLFVSAVFCWLLFELVDLILPIRHPLLVTVLTFIRQLERGYLIVLLLVVILLVAYLLYLSRNLLFGHPESILFFVYVIWLIISRFLLITRSSGSYNLSGEDVPIAIDSVILLLVFI